MKVWSSTDALCCGIILFGVGRRMDLQPARLNTPHSGLLFSVGRHTTRAWNSTDVLYCGMILFSVGIRMDLQPAHYTRFTVVLLFSVCRQAHNEGLDLNYRCTVLWYGTVRYRQTNGSTIGSLNTLHSGVVV